MGDGMSKYMENLIRNNFKEGQIFTIDDIQEITTRKKNTIAQALKRLHDKKIIKKINDQIDKGYKGGYYLPEISSRNKPITLFRNDFVHNAYISDGEDVYGIYTGLQLLNKWNLTQQVSTSLIKILSNKVDSIYRNRKLDITVRKASFPISKYNKNIVELFEVLKYLDRSISTLSRDTENRIIAKRINLKFSKREKLELFHYLYLQKNKMIKNRFNELSIYLDKELNNYYDIYKGDIINETTPKPKVI